VKTSTEDNLQDAWATLPALEDPYPVIKRFRDEQPVFRTPEDYWFVTTYELVNSVVRTPALWASNHMVHSKGAASDPYLNDPRRGTFSEIYRRVIMFQDGADHKRLRRLSQPVFSPRKMESFRTTIRQAVDIQLDEAIEAAGSSRETDIIASLTLPMPTRIILDMFGLPQTEAPRFYETTDFIIPPIERGSPEEWFTLADEVFQRQMDFITAVAQERRGRAEGDLLQLIAEAEDDSGERLSDLELVGFVTFLVTAGYETTANTFGNGLYWLLQHPEQVAALQNDPSLVPQAVEEMLRYDVATRNAGPRFATEDTTLGGQRIRKGEKVLASIHGANRDPNKFADPDRFDITRDPNPHLSFIAGPHACLGMPLARIELQEALKSLLERIPDLTLDAEVHDWHRSLMIRGLDSLPVRW